VKCRLQVGRIFGLLVAVVGFACPPLSAERGAQWRVLNPGITDVFGSPASVYCILLDPSDESSIVIGTDNGIVTSSSRGASWRGPAAGTEALFVVCISRDPIDSRTLYAGTLGDGVFKSVDTGETWTPTGNHDFWSASFNGSVLAIACDPLLPDVTYGGTLSALVISSDGGSSWRAVELSLPGERPAFFSSLATDSVTGAVYAGTAEQGIFVSFDHGDTWKPLNPTGVRGVMITSLAVHPSQPGIIYASLENNTGCIPEYPCPPPNGGFLKSSDGGARWELFPDRSIASGSTIVIPARAPDLVFTIGIPGVIQSKDGGAHWATVGIPQPEKLYGPLAVDQFGETLYVGAGPTGLTGYFPAKIAGIREPTPVPIIGGR
jgi:BNR/Asp-box repeat